MSSAKYTKYYEKYVDLSIYLLYCYIFIGDEFMNCFNEKLINKISDKKLTKYLMKCNFGLEKENVRVDKVGRLAYTPHPEVFGDRLKNPYIKTDFSESQLEMATPILHTIDATYDYLENLHDTISLELENEYLWTQSNPPCLPNGKEIPIAHMGDKSEEEFRSVLAEKYGRKKQLISGIHYNFSFTDDFLKILYNEMSDGEDYIDFKNKIYLKISRNFLKYRWLLIYLTGASPVFHNTFIEKYVADSDSFDEESCYFPDMISLRNSNYGYKNRKNFYVSFNSVNEYIKDINELVNKGELQDICEFYGPIRLKTGNNDNLSNELLKDGIKYLEFRVLDLNPLYKIGISKDTLYLVHLFILYSLFKDDEHFSFDEDRIANENSQLASLHGLSKNLNLFENQDKKVPFREKGVDILNEMGEMLKLLHLNSMHYMDLISEEKNTVINPYNTSSAKIIQGVKEDSFINFHMKKAKEYLNESMETLSHRIDINNKLKIHIS